MTLVRSFANLSTLEFYECPDGRAVDIYFSGIDSNQGSPFEKSKLVKAIEEELGGKFVPDVEDKPSEFTITRNEYREIRVNGSTLLDISLTTSEGAEKASRIYSAIAEFLRTEETAKSVEEKKEQVFKIIGFLKTADATNGGFVDMSHIYKTQAEHLYDAGMRVE